jgi:hypothetical protein
MIIIAGMGVVGPNEKYLENTLKEFKRLCDYTILVTNNADEKTKELIKAYGFEQYEDNRVWGIHQPDIKTDLLRKVGERNPHWVIALDCDEVFAPSFTRQEAERLANTGEIAWYFMVVNLYNDKDHFVHGAGIQRFWNIRFFKYLPEQGLQYLKKNLHCGLAPPFAYKYGWHAPYYLEHYGLMAKEDRLRKVERYRKFDPDAKFKDKAYYDDLIRDIAPRAFNRDGLLRQLRESKETQPRNMPKSLTNNKEHAIENESKQKFAYVRTPSGSIVDIPVSQVEETLKRKGFSFFEWVNDSKVELEALFGDTIISKPNKKK